MNKRNHLLLALLTLAPLLAAAADRPALSLSCSNKVVCISFQSDIGTKWQLQRSLNGTNGWMNIDVPIRATSRTVRILDAANASKAFYRVVEVKN